MKIYKLPLLADATHSNEYCLGPGLDTGSVYLLYGRLRPGETERKITTSEGAEEIICIVKGTVKVKAGNYSFAMSAGEAFASRKPQTFILDNTGPEEAIYISAGSRGFSQKEKPPEKPVESAAGETPPQAAAPSEITPGVEGEAEYIIMKDDTLKEES